MRKSKRIHVRGHLMRRMEGNTTSVKAEHRRRIEGIIRASSPRVERTHPARVINCTMEGRRGSIRHRYVRVVRKALMRVGSTLEHVTSELGENVF